MKYFSKLNPSLKVGILTYLFSIFGFLLTLFLLFQGHQDVPYGFLFAGGVIGTVNFLAGLVEHFSKDKSGSILSIIFLGIRMVVILMTMLLIALMYYRWNLPLFNLFVYIGVYTVSIIITVVIHLKERR